MLPIAWFTNRPSYLGAWILLHAPSHRSERGGVSQRPEQLVCTAVHFRSGTRAASIIGCTVGDTVNAAQLILIFLLLLLRPPVATSHRSRAAMTGAAANRSAVPTRKGTPETMAHLSGLEELCRAAVCSRHCRLQLGPGSNCSGIRAAPPDGGADGNAVNAVNRSDRKYRQRLLITMVTRASFNNQYLSSEPP